MLKSLQVWFGVSGVGFRNLGLRAGLAQKPSSTSMQSLALAGLNPKPHWQLSVALAESIAGQFLLVLGGYIFTCDATAGTLGIAFAWFCNVGIYLIMLSIVVHIDIYIYIQEYILMYKERERERARERERERGREGRVLTPQTLHISAKHTNLN